MPRKTTGVGLYVASERHLALLPSRYVADGTKRGVLYLPAKNQTAADVLSDFVARAVVAAGFPLVSFDVGNPTGGTFQYGSDTVVVDTTGRCAVAKAYMESAFGVKTGGVLFLAGSGGALNGLVRARVRQADFTAMALMIPPIHVDYAYDNDVSGTVADVDAIYGAGNWDSVKALRDPWNFGSSLDLPMKVWHGTEDLFTPLADYTAWAATVGANCVLRSGGAGVGHSTLWINPDEVIEFLRANE